MRGRNRHGIPAAAVWVGVLCSFLCAGLVLLLAVVLVPQAMEWGKLWLAIGGIGW
jgi:hypothetical protein